MKALDAVDRFAESLRARGVALTEQDLYFHGRGADAWTAWEVFRALATEPFYTPFERWGTTCHVDETLDGDLLLFDAFSDDVDGLSVDFRRQFSFLDSDGEYLGMNALTLTFNFALDPGLPSADGVILWGCGGPPWTGDVAERSEARTMPFAAALGWIAEVEATPAFMAVHDREPTSFRFIQSDV